MSNIIYHNADSLEVLKSIPDGSVDFILTDPPYEVDATSGGGYVNNKANTKPIAERIGHLSQGFDMDTYFQEFERVLKKMNTAIFCSNKQVPKIMSWFMDRGYFTTLLVWHKYNAIPSVNNKYAPDLEFIVLARETGSPFNNMGVKEQSKLFRYPFPSGKDRIHPTEKPVNLLRRLLRIHTNEGNIVLDPFAGSMTTGIACHKENRDAVLIEIDKDMFEKAKTRLEGIRSQLAMF